MSERKMQNLDDYTIEAHKANENWWKCFKCSSTGFQKIYGQLVYGDTTPILVSIPCPYCIDGKSNRNIGELLMLQVSELAEAMEGHRKGLMDDKLPQYEMLDVELVDCFIRICDLLGSRKAPFQDIYEAKMAFNANREDHKIENRLKEGGKRF